MKNNSSIIYVKQNNSILIKTCTTMTRSNYFTRLLFFRAQSNINNIWTLKEDIVLVWSTFYPRQFTSHLIIPKRVRHFCVHCPQSILTWMTSRYAYVSINWILFGRKRKTEILVGLETIAYGAASITSS